MNMVLTRIGKFVSFNNFIFNLIKWSFPVFAKLPYITLSDVNYFRHNCNFLVATMLLAKLILIFCLIQFERSFALKNENQRNLLAGKIRQRLAIAATTKKILISI